MSTEPKEATLSLLVVVIFFGEVSDDVRRGLGVCGFFSKGLAPWTNVRRFSVQHFGPVVRRL